MKIIYLDSGRLPTEKAHGYQIMKMCEAMAGLGHEVRLVTSSRRNPIKTDPFDYYGIKRNFRISKLWSLDVVNIVPKYGSWVSRVSFLCLAKIYLAFQNYDVLYLREHLSGNFFRDYIMEVHTLPSRIEKRDLEIWKRAKKIVVTTPFIKERLALAGVLGSKIIVAPDAVDLEVFDFEMSKEEARKKLGLPENGIILGYTGSLKTNEMEKGIAIVLRTLQSLPGLRFIAVGGLERHIREYEDLAKTLGIAERVEFRKRVDLGTLAVYQKVFDVLLISFPKNDHYAYFTSPLKLFEYMASGRPVVASDLPSLREVLNEKNSILVHPDDPEALASGIKKVLENQVFADKLAQQAREDVVFYTWQNRAKMIIQ